MIFPKFLVLEARKHEAMGEAKSVTHRKGCKQNLVLEVRQQSIAKLLI
jgi:hypothetical protein